MAVVTDNFNRANGALGSDWTAQAGFSGGLTIVSNQASTASSDGTYASWWSSNTFGSDQYAEADVDATPSTSSIGVILRWNPATLNGYVFYRRDSGTDTWHISRIDTGVETILTTVAVSGTGTLTLRAEAEGTTLRILEGGTEVLSTTDSNHSGTRIGIVSARAGGNAALDDFDGGDFSAAVDATATPSTVAASAGVASPTVTAGASVVAGLVAAAISVLAPTVSTDSSSTATPSPVAVPVAVPAPTVSTASSATATPSTVAASVTVPAPSVSSSSSATAPRNLRPDDAFGYSSEVLLGWDAPTSDGGSTITGYRIRRSTDDGDTWTTHTADTGTTTTSATLTGLVDGTRYQFEVAAINGAGVGATVVSEWGCTPVSAASALTPPTATTQTAAPWHLARIDQTGLPVGTAYNYRYTGAGVTVYVVDSGIRATHNEFSGITVTSGYSVAVTSATNDVGSHGTQVASEIAGATYGVAKGATLVPVKMFEDDHNPAVPYPTEANFIDCLEWIEAEHDFGGGPAVINLSLSLGPSTPYSTVVTQMETMVDAGFAFVVSGGNDNGAPSVYDQFPTGYTSWPGVTIVAASADDDSFWSDGGFGTTLDARFDGFAPGQDVPFATSVSDSSTGTGSGTSQAAPIVAGTFAMWLEANPDLTPRQLQDLYRASSTKDAVTGTLLGTPNRLIYTLADIPPGGSFATATTVATSMSVPAPSVSTASDATASPAAVATSMSVPPPSVSAGSTVSATASPSVVATLATVPAPSVSTSDALLRLGSTQVDAVYLGATQVDAVYYGSTQVL